MKIKRIEATAVTVPVHIDVVGLDEQGSVPVCIVEIETDNGILGWGMTGVTDVGIVADMVNKVAGPALIGDDPTETEKIWTKLYWLLCNRGQTGIACHAIGAVDVALWDIKGRALDQPVWRLLGGARERVPAYITFGYRLFDRDKLAEFAKHWVDQGYKGLKMTVGDGALKRRDEPRPMGDVIKEDAARVKAVREAVGDEIELMVDANHNLDQYHAINLSRMIEQYDIKFFEEPIIQNDVRLMATMRQMTSIPLACGQNEGLAYRFRDWLVHESVDIIQPNVCIAGGFTQCIKIAGLAAAFNVPMMNGASFDFHNAHLHGGLSNGTELEHRYMTGEMYERLFTGLPEMEDGWVILPEKPGLGFDADREAIQEFAT